VLPGQGCRLLPNIDGLYVTAANCMKYEFNQMILLMIIVFEDPEALLANLRSIAVQNWGV
jgi:hypothetical protein